MPEPWYRRIFRRKVTQVVYLEQPIPVEISSETPSVATLRE
jgi:hypothetical protein